MYKIFLVEDDPALREAICQSLRAWGYEEACAADFQRVLTDFAACQPHLVLMDIKLPFFNGYHWCREIRRVSGVPVVFLSSAADSMNIVMAMNMGGDDFIPKPFDSDVMLAKVQAILRRAYDMPGTLPVLEHRGAVLNLADASLTFGEQRTELTRNEFRILQTLLEHRGQVVSRDTLMTRLWQMDMYVEENTLTVNVNRLRKKLESLGLPDFITTRVGSGYIVE